MEGRYFSADAVLTNTTRSSGWINPRSASSGSAARVAAPSGDQANCRRRHSSWITLPMASSETESAQPPVARMIRKTLICPTFCATFSPVATVDPGAQAVYALTCPSDKQCTVVDLAGNAITFDPRSPESSSSRRLAQSNHALLGIACPSIYQCTAVDQAVPGSVFQSLTTHIAVLGHSSLP